MKKIIKYIFRFISLMMFLIISNNIAYASSDAKKREFFNYHSELLKNIKEYSKTENKSGNIKKDYIKEIIHNNNTQISMCENIIKYGDNRDVRNLSKNLIRNSMDMNRKLNNLLEKIENDNEKIKDDDFYNDLNKYYNEMILELECLKNYDEIEKIFLNSCTKLNRFTIKLSNCVGKYTSDKSINDFASAIKKNMMNENKELEKMYKKIK